MKAYSLNITVPKIAYTININVRKVATPTPEEEHSEMTYHHMTKEYSKDQLVDEFTRVYATSMLQTWF